jgi:hypothetical protein
MPPRAVNRPGAINRKSMTKETRQRGLVEKQSLCKFVEHRLSLL